MEILAKEFTKNGFRHKQLKRSGDTALYERQKEDQPIHYEVVKIREREDCVIGKKEYKATEIYPSSSQWGVFGWTLPTLARAEEKFNEIVEKDEQGKLDRGGV